MFVFSLRFTKKKVLLSLFATVAVIGIILAATSGGKNRAHDAAGNPPENILAATNEQRVSFLSTYGLTAKTDPIEIIEVIIPAEFDETYESYNSLQKSAGFNLADYRGKKVKKWVYEIPDFPSATSTVRATLLVLDGKVIGGDIAESAVGGFLRSLNNK